MCKVGLIAIKRNKLFVDTKQESIGNILNPDVSQPNLITIFCKAWICMNYEYNL